MIHATAEAARIDLADLNRKAHNINEALRSTPNSASAQLTALYADRAELNQLAKLYGFVRIFDGSFKLNLSLYAKG